MSDYDVMAKVLDDAYFEVAGLNPDLVRAAPALLAALETAVRDHVGTADDCEPECWSHAATQAIASARGSSKPRSLPIAGIGTNERSKG